MIISLFCSRLLKPENLNAPEIKLQQCALNISQCEVSENSKAFSVIIYNPSSQKVDKYVRVPVVGTQYVIQNSKGKRAIILNGSKSILHKHFIVFKTYFSIR